MKKIFFMISFSALLITFITSAGLSEETKAPKIYFEEKTFDAGEIKSGDYLEHSFKAFNKGNGTLEISQVKGS